MTQIEEMGNGSPKALLTQVTEPLAHPSLLRPRGSTRWGRQAAGALLALMLLPALIPWQVQIRRYSIYNNPYDVRCWRVGRYVNSVGGGDVIEANGLGTLQIVFKRPKGNWGRPWPF